MSDWTTIADIVIKGLALVGTASFFGYKTLSGFNNQNLSLSLKCDRYPSLATGDSSDLLVISVSIEKGTTAALALETLEACVIWNDGERRNKVIEMPIGRLTTVQPTAASTPKIKWGELSADRPFLYISPGGKTAFGCWTSVPETFVCLVEVVALGRRRRSTFLAQWKISTAVPLRQQAPAGGVL